MSNKVLNAVIALIENRPSTAREMLRSPEVKIPMGDVQIRLSSALEKREKAAIIEVLKDVLKTSLRIDIAETYPDEFTDAYLQGVAAVERIIEDHIVKLEPTNMARYNS